MIKDNIESQLNELNNGGLKMKTLLYLCLFLLLSCSATTLAPNNIRTVKYQEKTSATKDQAYTSSLAYIAKNFGDSNHAIKAKDKDAGIIVLKGNINCNTLRQAGDPNDYSLKFNLSIKAKDSSYLLVFDDLQMLNDQGQMVRWDYNQIVDADKVSKVKPCLDPVRDGLMNELSL